MSDFAVLGAHTTRDGSTHMVTNLSFGVLQNNFLPCLNHVNMDLSAQNSLYLDKLASKK